MNRFQDSRLRPNRKSGWAVSLGYGYRTYNLWYSRPPWDNWAMSYRISLHRPEEGERNGVPWSGDVGFTYLKNDNEGLDRCLDGLVAVESQVTRTDQVEDEDGQVVEEYGVIEASLEGDALEEPFANTLADTLGRFVELITPVVDAYQNERDEVGA